jgi:hypothetical protein
LITKVFSIVSVIAVATLLAGGTFVGYLTGTGKLSASRIETIAGVLRGELDPPLQTHAPEVGPTTAPVAAAPAEPRGSTESELRDLRQRQHLETLENERAARDLAAQRLLLDQVLQHVVQEQERLANDKTEFAKQREKIKDTARDVGFQKELELVSGLQPRQAKEHLLRLWQKQPADAVRLLNAMDEGRARRILEQFKTPEELQTQSDLLEQIRLQGMEGHASTSGKIAGAAAP